MLWGCVLLSALDCSMVFLCVEIHAFTREVQFLEICGNLGGHMQVWQPSVSHASNRSSSWDRVSDFGLEPLEVEPGDGKNCRINKYTVRLHFSFLLGWNDHR